MITFLSRILGTMTAVIRPVRAGDRGQWNALWQGYLDFYETELSDEQTELTWNRLVDEQFGMFGLVAELDGRLVGLAHYSFTHSSWEVNPYLYLEDLFVNADARGLGVGKSLILKLDEIAKAVGINRVYWETRSDNLVARRLYDSVAQLSEFVKYTRSLGE